MKLRHLLDLRSMRDHYRSVTLRVRLEALRYVLACRINATICEFRGHAFVSDAHDAENGSEDLTCNRCGHSERLYF